jgi:ParB family transcriptional regulator, chromosome partitioning protein
MAKPKIIEVPLNVIRIGKVHWTRKHTKEDIKRIAEEIESVGLINPITIRIEDSRPTLIAGHKRFLACRDILKYTSIPAIVIEADDLTAELLSLYENLGQTEMTQAEVDAATTKAVALEMKKQKKKIPDAQVIDTVALRTHQAPQAVKQSVRRQEVLIPEVKKALRDGKISKSQADEMAKANEPTQQSLLQEALEEGASHKKLHDKRIATKGSQGKDDKEYVNIRLAQRKFAQCLTAGTQLTKALAEFIVFVGEKRVNLKKLGGVKDAKSLDMVTNQISNVKKLLRN